MIILRMSRFFLPQKHTEFHRKNSVCFRVFLWLNLALPNRFR